MEAQGRPDAGIGRLAEESIVLDPNGVNRQHAEIRREGATLFYLADLRSREQDEAQRAKRSAQQERRLVDGDRINICDVEMIFFYVTPPMPGARRGTPGSSWMGSDDR